MTAPTKAIEVISPGQSVVRRPGDWNKELAVIIRDSLAPGLDGKQLLVYSKICQATGLDPFRRQIYAWIGKGNRLVIHVGIGGWRAIAARTGVYAGQAPPEWCGPDGQWRGVWLEEGPPAAARVGIYRNDNPNPTYGVVTWKEFQRTAARSGAKGATPWDDSPSHMLEVAAERHALQKACPEAYEAAMGIMQEAGATVQVTGDEELPELPEGVDAATGEIVDAGDPDAGVTEQEGAPAVGAAGEPVTVEPPLFQPPHSDTLEVLMRDAGVTQWDIAAVVGADGLKHAQGYMTAHNLTESQLVSRAADKKLAAKEARR